MRRRRGGDGETESPNQVALSVHLIQDESQGRAFLKSHWSLALENGDVRLAHLRMNAPGRVGFAIDCFADFPVLLVEVRRRIPQFHSGQFCGLGRGPGRDAKLREMEVAIVLPARPFLRQTLVREQLQSNRGNALERSLRADRVGINVGFGFRNEQRQVRQLGKSRAAAGVEADRVENGPVTPAIVGSLFPGYLACNDSRLDFRISLAAPESFAGSRRRSCAGAATGAGGGSADPQSKAAPRGPPLKRRPASYSLFLGIGSNLWS